MFVVMKVTTGQIHINLLKGLSCLSPKSEQTKHMAFVDHGNWKLLLRGSFLAFAFPRGGGCMFFFVDYACAVF
jgi:hypothetical protein